MLYITMVDHSISAYQTVSESFAPDVGIHIKLYERSEAAPLGLRVYSNLAPGQDLETL